jgi:hypothetical protein
MSVFDTSVHNLLQDLGGDEFAESLARALDSPPVSQSSKLLVVKLPSHLHDFLTERCQDLTDHVRFRCDEYQGTLTPEMLLQYIVKYYSEQARW